MPTSSPSFFLDPLDGAEELDALALLRMKLGPVYVLDCCSSSLLAPWTERKRVRLAVDSPLSQESEAVMNVPPCELFAVAVCSGSSDAVLSGGLEKWEISMERVELMGKSDRSHVTVAFGQH